jgi:hypothetical protein
MPGDAPIQCRDEDELGRAPFAQSIAMALRTSDASAGAVVALSGPWGIGKTSVLNMIAESLHDERALDIAQFNPWLFSGTDQLLADFFSDLAAQLRLGSSKREKIADRLDSYGDTLALVKAIPVVGSWAALVGGGGKLVGRLVKPKAKDGLTAQRSRLRDALASLDRPIVIMIDDIDRLRPSEIGDILRLVRLTGSFPNLIYLLAFDRQRVEAVLTQQGFEGGPYLEKIVEYAYDVPAIPPTRLQRILADGIDDRTAGFVGVSGADRWPDIFYQVMRPLFDSLRDVKRYLAVLPAVLATVGDEVALADVLALEAVRVVLPTVHARLIERAAHLAGPSATRGQEDARRQVEELIDAAGTYADVIRELCRLLFPGTEPLFGGPAYGPEHLPRWRRDRRVASPQVLGFYLTRTLEPGTASAGLVTAIVDALGDPQALHALIDSLDADAVEDLLQRLEAWEADFPPEIVEPAVSVLLDLYARLPRRRGAIVEPHTLVNRLILRLLRRVADPSVMTQIVTRLCDGASTLQGRFRLLRLVGHTPNIGHRLISASQAEPLEQNLYQTLRHASAEQLQPEHDLLLMLYLALQASPSDRQDLDRELRDPRLAEALISDAAHTVSTQQLGSLNVQHEDVLDWDGLTAVFGDETTLVRIIDHLPAHEGAQDAAGDSSKALDLAHRYRNGWRPNIPWAPPILNTVAANSGPRHLLTLPTLPDAHGPTLVIRAVARHRLDGGRANRISLASSDAHERIRTALTAAPIIESLRGLARSRGLPALNAGWQTGPEHEQNAKLAVETTRVTAGDTTADIEARCGVAMPGSTDSDVRVIIDLLVTGKSPGDETTKSDPDVLPVTLPETRDLIVTALRSLDHIDRALTALMGDPNPHAWPSRSTSTHTSQGRQTDRLLNTT